MIQVLKRWFERYFADEEAVLVVLFLIAALVVVATLGPVLAPMFAAIIIAFLLQGAVFRLKQWGMGHIAAVSLTVFIFVSVLVLTLVFVLPVFWTQTVNLFNEAPRMLREGQQLLLLLPEKYPSMITEVQVTELIGSLRADLGQFGQSILSFSMAQLPVILTILIYLVLVPILVFFFLKDSHIMLDKMGGWLPNKRPVMQKISQEMNQQIANYVRGKAIEIVVVTSASIVTFTLLDLRYALLLSLMMGLSVLIPYIGAALATVPVALIGFFQFGWSSEFFYVMLAYGIIQALDGNVLVPLIFSEIVKMHPVVIILAVLVFGGLWGFWGLFFAIPLATLCKAVINAWPTKDERNAVAI